MIPPLVAGEPQHHSQQPVSVSGVVSLAGADVVVDGRGFRDRTWGYRDESADIDEYISFMVVFDEFALTALRFHDTHGGNRVDGFFITEGAIAPVTGVEVTRDASGLLAVGEIQLADGRDLRLAVTSKLGGFWVPMGPARKGPTLSAYDELCALVTPDGATGHGFIEHASLRRLF